MTAYQYDAANRLINASGVVYTWDDNGNLLNDGAKSYTYNQANQLTNISGAGLTWSASYNGEGARLKQIVNGLPTTYTLDLAAPLVQVLLMQDAGGKTAYLYGVTRIGEQQSGGWLYHLADALGSVRQIVDGSGNVTLAESYEPYGSVLSSNGTASSIFGYSGEQVDTTGLVYLRARYLNPRLGIFLARDPWSGDQMRPGSMNGFGYVEGNPVNAIDPSGQIVCFPPYHWEVDPETGQWRCVGPNRDGQPPLPPIFGQVGTQTMQGTGDPASTLAKLLILAGCTVIAEAWQDLQPRAPQVIVELGAGDYRNAIKVKAMFPSATVYATNLVEEWTVGKIFTERNRHDPIVKFFTDMYAGWIAAKAANVKVGDTQPLENKDVPSGIADIVYSIFPYPHAARETGEHAARIAQDRPATIVAVTSGNGAVRDAFSAGYSHTRFSLVVTGMMEAPGGFLGLDAPQDNQWGEFGQIMTRYHYQILR